MTGAAKIVVNTAATYVRMGLVLLTGFITIPIAIRCMGVSDYGIFSVIAGSLAFFLVVAGALAMGIERHVSFAMGSGDRMEAAQWLQAGIVVQSSWATLMAIGALLGRSWILHRALNLPAARAGAANWVFAAVLTTLVIGVVQSPFFALVLAHEDIFVQSLASVAGTCVFLTGVSRLPHSHGDVLIRYALLYAFNQVLMFGAVTGFAILHYPEGRFWLLGRPSLQRIREILHATIWNGVWAGAILSRTQGPSLLLNRFFGTVLNGSYGISVQTGGSLNNLSSAVYRATFPRIVKSYSAEDRARMERLACACCKYSFLFLWMFLAPVLFNLQSVLSLWLHPVPAFAALFVLGSAVMILVDQTTCGYQAVMQAAGKLAVYQLTTGTLICLAVPVGYISLRLGAPVSVLVWAGVLASCLGGFSQIAFTRVLGGIHVGVWLRSVGLPVAIAVVSVVATAQYTAMHLHPGMGRVGVILGETFALVLPTAWFSSGPEEIDLVRRWLRGVIRGFGGSKGGSLLIEGHREIRKETV